MTGAAGPGHVAWKRALGLIVITDAGLAAPRSVMDVVRKSLQAGARCVQLRDKRASARELAVLGNELRALTLTHQALLFVNDRVDVALTVGADGVHLGPEDLPVAAARRIAPRGFLIGFSADHPTTARSAVEAGADYIGCGTVFPTSSKPDAGPSIGLEGLARVVESVEAPVVGIGGIGPDEVGRVLAAGATGVAVIAAVMASPDPALATAALLSARTPRTSSA